MKIALPRVHMAGSDAHHNAHLEVGQHGFALFLTPTADAPVLDVDGSWEQLDAVVQNLQQALASRRAAGDSTEHEPVQMALPRSDTRADSHA